MNFSWRGSLMAPITLTIALVAAAPALAQDANLTDVVRETLSSNPDVAEARDLSLIHI